LVFSLGIWLSWRRGSRTSRNGRKMPSTTRV